MRGPEGARDRLALFVGEVMAEKTSALRQAYSYDDAELPEPDTITSGEKPDNALGKFGHTWIEIVNPRMRAQRTVDITPYGPEWEIDYSLRVYVWALGASWADSIDRRDRVTGAVRALLWEFPTLKREGGDSGYLVNYSTWGEEYGVPSRVNNPSGRAWAAAIMTFDLRVWETLERGALRPPIGTAERSFVDTSVAGPYEPFPADGPAPGDPLVPDSTVTTTG